jgi:acyl-CoA dehydrogenase
MKSPYFNKEHDAFRDTARHFIEKEVAPCSDEWEKDRRIPRSIWKRMGDLGFLGISHPEEYGGTGADFFYSVVFLEELTRSTMAGFAAAVGTHEYMASEYIQRFATDDLKKQYLIPAIAGEKIGAIAITEPDTGSDVASIRTRAVRDGESYIINGAKTFITNGYYGDFIIIAAKTDQDAGFGGISLILVDKDTLGLERRKLEKMGWHSSDTAELHFDDMKVPVANIIGNENEGFYYIMECFQLERLVAAIMAIAGARLGLEHTLGYISERKAFGRRVSKFQTIRHTMVDLKTEIEAAQQLTYNAAWRFVQGENIVMECSMAKLLTTELAKKAADKCLQFFGGYGYMEEYLISRMYRDARVGTIVGGTSEIMREIIARLMIDQVSYETRDEKVRGAREAIKDSGEKETKGEFIGPVPKTADEIIKSLPSRFRAEKAVTWETIVHFDISGSEGGHYTVRIGKGNCTIEAGLQGEPKCTVKTSDKIYRDIELGRTNPEVAFMMRKIRISNLKELMQFTKMFQRLPKG